MSLTIHSARTIQVRRGIVAFGVLVSMAVSSPAFGVGVLQPVIDTPQYGVHGLGASPLVQGRAEAGTDVEVHIDGKAAGKAALMYAATEGVLATFNYTPLEPLTPGYHSLEVFSRDTTGIKEARQSFWWFVEVKNDIPSPVIYAAYQSRTGGLVVEGVVKSGYRVRIYVDGIARMTSEVMVHQSGSRGFRVVIAGVTIGEHAVSASAVRADGIESEQSVGMRVAESSTANAPTASQGTAPGIAAQASPAPGAATAGTQNTGSTGNTPSLPQTYGTSTEAAVPAVTPEAPKAPSAPIKPATPGLMPIISAQDAFKDPSLGEATSTREAREETSQAPASESGTAQGGNKARVPLLAAMGVILVGLIIWYATKDDVPPAEGKGGSGMGNSGSSTDSGISSSAGPAGSSSPPPPSFP